SVTPSSQTEIKNREIQKPNQRPRKTAKPSSPEKISGQRTDKPELNPTIPIFLVSSLHISYVSKHNPDTNIGSKGSTQAYPDQTIDVLTS
ncbi:hypothetical protein AB6A40_011206, partial [Gnathostoma spinigerum]